MRPARRFIWNFASVRVSTPLAGFPISRISATTLAHCACKVSADMTDSELKVGLAFNGISCIAASAVLLYMRRKAEET